MYMVIIANNATLCTWKLLSDLHLKYSYPKNVMEIMWHGRSVSNGMMEIILEYVSVSNQHVHFKLT